MPGVSARKARNNRAVGASFARAHTVSRISRIGGSPAIGEGIARPFSIAVLLVLAGCARTSDASLKSLTIDGVPVADLDAAAGRAPHPMPADSAFRVAAVPRDPDARVRVCARRFEDHASDCVMGSGIVELEGVTRVTATVTSGEEQSSTEVILIPDSLPRIEVETLGDATEGAWFLGLMGSSYAGMIVGQDGTPLWYHQGLFPAFDLRAAPDGSITYVQNTGFEGRRIGIQLNPDTTIRRTWEPPPTFDGLDVHMDHHDFQILDSGNALILGLVWTVEDLRELGGTVDTTVLHNTIQEVTPDGRVVWEWDTRGQVDAEDVAYWSYSAVAGGWEYAHVNSLEIDPADGSLLVSVRLTNQVLKIARQPTEHGGHTFQPGEIVWRLGGRSSDFEIDDARPDGSWGFAGQHSARPVPGGLILYDNAMRAESDGLVAQADVERFATGPSRYVEYALDTDAMTATVRGSFALEGSGFTHAMGSAQRMGDGHTVIGWGGLPGTGPWPMATEVDADDQPVQHLWVDGSHTYRAAKHVLVNGAWTTP